MHYLVVLLCQLFGVHRSSYQAWQARDTQPDPEVFGLIA
ncbi:hypothetical protein XIS1_1320008 [Xenorhabdus innexi]|uniref:Transposase n=1 Tax=Xenorhabdus innexi TaxID=290109 RepID=A0A1N6MT95_9GAMM|nr:hypothetical protein XIS1_1320008 [Xenorhabdus innexi]